MRSLTSVETFLASPPITIIYEEAQAGVILLTKSTHRLVKKVVPETTDKQPSKKEKTAFFFVDTDELLKNAAGLNQNVTNFNQSLQEAQAILEFLHISLVDEDVTKWEELVQLIPSKYFRQIKEKIMEARTAIDPENKKQQAALRAFITQWQSLGAIIIKEFMGLVEHLLITNITSTPGFEHYFLPLSREIRQLREDQQQAA